MTEDRIYACYDLSLRGYEASKAKHLVRLESLDFEVLENLIQSTFSNEVVLKADSLLDFRSEIMNFIKNLTLILFGREMRKESEEVFRRFGFQEGSVSRADFAEFLASHELTIEHFQEMLLQDAYSIIESEKEIREKEEKKKILEQFIAEIGSDTGIILPKPRPK